MSVAPTGTVTFLFTDIEGSIRLWEDNPDTMPAALARHDQILRKAVEDHEGTVFMIFDDAFCVAFPTADTTLQAALAVQTALAAEAWETESPLRVRMALHTGAAQERGGDYFGPPLNRVARLMGAGHGGQVLLSEATQGLVQDTLPPDTSLRDLSRHRLRDLGRPEQVFQLLHPALTADFPPLRSLDNSDLPNNLPPQPTSFIGREKQVTEVKALLDKTRLLTLTGAGGSGKMRLSLQVAADLLTGDGDGVWLVELAALSHPALVPQAVADVLGIKERAGQTLQQTLVDWLKAKRLLLVLDNCEHLVAACAALATDLLRLCPGVHVLASSREPLNVAGERTYRVPSLSLPDPKQAQTAEALSRFEAVRLFSERAQAVQASFAVTNQNAPAVAQVCFRLDGIPLALELAAARVRTLSVEEINTRLDHRFRLLTGGSRTLLPRQQTLRALIDWSYDLLTAAERTLFCRLSVFAGGWDLETAEAVCTGEGVEDWEVLDLLTGLVDKSLAVYEEGEDGGAGRCRLLETVRQYAGDHLEESGEAETVQDRAASWFLALAEEAEPQLTGPEQGSWLSRLEREHDNLRAGLAWYEHQTDGGEKGRRLVGALWRFWFVRGYFTEGRQWLGRSLARAEPVSDGQPRGQEAGEVEGGEVFVWRSKALNGAGNLARMQSDYAGAQAMFEESLAIRRRLEDRQGIAASLNNLGLTATKLGDLVRARTLFAECLTIMRQLGDQQGISVALGNLGLVANYQGDLAGARALLEESLAIKRQLGDQQGIAASLNNLGIVALKQSDLAKAQALFAECVTIMRQLEDQQSIAVALGNLGLVALRQGHLAGARALFEESLALFRQLGQPSGIAESLDGMAGVAQGESRLSRAARLGGAASALHESLGSPRPPAEQADTEKTMASVREALGEGAFSAAWVAGQSMTWEQAVDYALSDAP